MFQTSDEMVSQPKRTGPAFGTAYAWSIALLLLTVNMLSYVDRTILSVLAEPIKHDLGLKDSELGFLYGTAFILPNVIFCLAMGRIADRWLRGRLLAIGLALWSTATLVSGTTSSYIQLAMARCAVGLGEATTSPCSHSLLADAFPQHQRSRVLSIYLCGVYIGMAVSIAMGGWFAGSWASACEKIAPALCSLKGWQAAFIVAGAPGLVLAMLIALLPEPPRGSGTPPIKAAEVLRRGGAELATLVPPFTMLRLLRRGEHYMLRRNVLIATCITLVGVSLTAMLGSPMQWIALGLGCYALASWAQALSSRDADAFRVTFGSTTYRRTLLAFSLISSINQAVLFWAIPYAMRSIGLPPERAGILGGAALGIGSVVGVLAGGGIADRLRRRTLAGPLYVGLVSIILCFPFAVMLVMASDEVTFTIAYAGFAVTSNCWGGAVAAFVQDLTPPQMRGTTSATLITTMSLAAFAIGPYTAARLGELFGSLGMGILAMFALAPLAIVTLLLATRDLHQAFATRDELTPR